MKNSNKGKKGQSNGPVSRGTSTASQKIAVQKVHKLNKFKYGCSCEHCAVKSVIDDCCEKPTKALIKNRLDPWGEQNIVPSIGPLGKQEPKKHISLFNSATNSVGFAYCCINTTQSAQLSDGSGGIQCTGFQEGGMYGAVTNSSYVGPNLPPLYTDIPADNITNLFCSANPWPVNPEATVDDLYINIVSIGLEVVLTSVPNNRPVQGSCAVYQSRTSDPANYNADLAGKNFGDIATHPDAQVFDFNNKNGYSFTTVWKYRGGSFSGTGYGSPCLNNVKYVTGPVNKYWGGIGSMHLVFDAPSGCTFRIKATINTQASGKLAGGSHDPVESMIAYNQLNTAINSVTGPLVTKGSGRSEGQNKEIFVHSVKHLAKVAGGVAKDVLKDATFGAVSEAFKWL